MHDSKPPGITHLVSLKADFSGPAMPQKLALLKQAATGSVMNTVLLKNYHDCLLFLLAYPGNKAIYLLAQQQLLAIKKQSEKIFSHYSFKKQMALNGSGIYASEVVSAFSYDIALWLCNTFGNSVSLHSSGADAERVSKILEPFLPGIEYQQVTQANDGLLQRIQKLTGQKNRSASLQWLLQTLGNDAAPAQVRNILYDQLQVYVQWKLDHPFFNRTFLRSLQLEKIQYQKPLIKSYDRYIRKKIKAPFELTGEEKKQMLDIARAALALLCRETDPVSFGDDSSVKYFGMGNGISIALYSMLPQKRLSIESYTGYMAFINSVPAAYGGGWMLGQRCKIGINIFPALRGGNSTLLFAAILRLYHQHFNAGLFVVKPYQFGKNNSDGIRSGAFWFYYKLGFRSADPRLRQLADDEYSKKMHVKDYRTPPAVLRRFTSANMELVMDKKAFPGYDAGIISKAVTKDMIQHFNGNRQAALKHYTQQLKKMVRSTGLRLSPSQHQILTKQAPWMAVLFAGDQKMEGWTKTEKKQLVHLLLSKYAADEREYIIGMQQHKKLWRALNDIQH